MSPSAGANMDFAEFADAVDGDGDGIFRGFRAVRLYVLRCSARLPVRRGRRRADAADRGGSVVGVGRWARSELTIEPLNRVLGLLQIGTGAFAVRLDGVTPPPG